MRIKENENIPNSEVFILENGEPVKKNIENIRTQSEGGVLEVSFGEDFLICRGPAEKMFDGFLEFF